MNTGLEFRDKVFVITLKNYLKECENTEWVDKDKVVTKFMDYLVENTELFNLDKHTITKQIIFDKLLEFKKKGFNSNKYFELLYPEYYNAMIKEVIDAITLEDKHVYMKPTFNKRCVDYPEVVLDSCITTKSCPNDDSDDDLPDLIPSDHVRYQSVPSDDNDDDVPDLVPGDNYTLPKLVPINKYNCFTVRPEHNNFNQKPLTKPFFESTIEPDTNKNKLYISNDSHVDEASCNKPNLDLNDKYSCFRLMREENDFKPIFLTSPWLASTIEPDNNLRGILSPNDLHANDNVINKTFGETLRTMENMGPIGITNNDVEQTNVMFEDYKTTIIRKSYYRLNFIDSMLQYICDKYNVSDKSLILNNNVAIEKVKADTTFPNGYIIIKLNENSYELYEKQTNITQGRFYGVYTNVVVNKLGKLGKISY